MSVISDINKNRNRKRLEKVKKFLLELDSICDRLYSNIEYEGVLQALDKIEDVRVRYYLEYYELKGKFDEETEG